MFEIAKARSAPAIIGPVLLAAIGIILLSLIGWTWVSSDARQNKADQAVAYQTNRANHSITHKCADSVATVACQNEALDDRREYQRGEYDLAAQQDMADYAFATMVLAAISFCATALATVYIYRTLKATKGQLEHLRRPHLRVRHEKVEMQDGRWRSSVLVENLGDAPAHIRESDFTHGKRGDRTLPRPYDPPRRPGEQSLNPLLIDDKRRRGEIRNAIFPGHIVEWWFTTPEMPDSSASLEGRIVYTKLDYEDERHYRTLFCRELDECVGRYRPIQGDPERERED